jgi:hypothetical protein
MLFKLDSNVVYLFFDKQELKVKRVISAIIDNFLMLNRFKFLLVSIRIIFDEMNKKDVQLQKKEKLPLRIAFKSVL